MKIINNEEELISFIGVHEASFYSRKTAPVLYHGTDMTVIKMDKNSRQELIEACKTMIKQLFLVYTNYNFENRISELKNKSNDINTIIDAYSCASGMQINSPRYSYGHLYLTSEAKKAISYAKRSWICGELGYIAYFLKKGCDELGFVQPNDDEYIEAKKTFEKKNNKKSPCVLIYTEIPREDIELYGVTKQIQLDKPHLYNMVRLKNESKLVFDSATIIREDLFECLLRTDELIDKHFEEILLKAVQQVRRDKK